jgi:phosphoglycolate phosphatase
MGDLITPLVLLFDWSGTLSNDLKPVHLANCKLLEHYGFAPITFSEWRNLCCGNATDFALRYGISDEPTSIQKTFVSLFNEVVLGDGVEPFPYEGIRETLSKLKEQGHIMALVSSHPQEALEREAKAYGVDQFFTKIVGSVMDKTIVIRELHKEFGIALELIVYIGDTIQDMRAAKRARVRSVAVYTGYHTREILLQEQPDLLLEHVGLLPEQDLFYFCGK